MGMTGTVGYPTGLLAVAVLLAACSGKTTQQDASVIATVDGHELTTADLDEAPDAPANAERPMRAAVDSLIDEHLMAEQALADGLDNDPVVAHALENARRRVLAEAFAARLDRSRATHTAAEIEDYYRQHPALFAERRLYNLAIFAIDGETLNDELIAAIGHTASVDGLSRLLTQRSIRFELQQIERASDELPIGQLRKYSAASVGDVLVDPQANGPTRLIQVTGVELRPRSFENARRDIQRFLAQRDKAAAVDAYLARARSRAQITYPAQEPAPSPTRRTPAAQAGRATIAQGTSNSDAALTALNRRRM